ncbi:paraquat-inducible protein A [bacterium]|nr:paraquat-inducible protein A [bacterium]
MVESNAQPDLNQIIACHGCDLLLEDIPIKPGEKLFCPRCGELLKAPKKDSVNRSLALSLTGLLLFPFAMLMQVMTLDTMGIENSGNIVDGVITTWLLDQWFVAVILALTSILFPLAKLMLLFLVTLNLKMKRYPSYLRLSLRTYIHLDEWGMLEVYMIGILVTIVKMHHMAHIHYNTGFFCFIGILVATLGASAIMDEEEIWSLIEHGK